MAAAAIRELTGPITIRQETVSGTKNRTRWIATFSPVLSRLLRTVTEDDPAIPALVAAAGNPDKVEVVVELGEAMRRKVRTFLKMGMTEVEIAEAAGCGTATVSRIKRQLKQQQTA